ncbi:MAG TPA: DUF4846 domain-containing protein [Candidatus Kapabacteria bacterium]|nr:DUF4846 domain-containing protein [Candidatus Kapabacteria bacterium]
MNRFIILFVSLVYLSIGCGQGETPNQLIIKTGHKTGQAKVAGEKTPDRINPAGKTIATRFILPGGFERITVPAGSFAEYLRKLPLKPHGAKVKFYNGRIKPNPGIYDAVVDMDIDPLDLQQCADAIIRLRAEYLWGQKRYDDIHFNFTNGFRVDYSKWMQGYRIVVNGNKTSWAKSVSPSNSYKDFREYLKIIFLYAGTYSLTKELLTVNYQDLKIGDILTQPGFPGHAVIVVDLAVNNKSGEKIYLLAQSYMPAQETQVLQNPMNPNLSPWYALDLKAASIVTPERTFKKTDLRRFAGE